LRKEKQAVILLCIMIRTLVFFAYFWASLTLTLPLGIVLSIISLVFPVRAIREFLGLLVRAWARSILWASGSTVDVAGLEHVPRRGALVVVGNHQGDMDILVLLAYLPRSVGFMAKSQARWVPFINLWVMAIGSVFVNRSSIAQGMKSIDQGVQSVRTGKALAIFPEGTRSRSSIMLPFRNGSFKLATKAGALVLPVSIDGTWKIWEDKHRIVPSHVRFVVHPALPTAGMDAEARKALPELTRNIILQELHPELRFRPVRESDRDAVIALCRTIWDGTDYLPSSFDAWLSDREGFFTACVSPSAAGLERLVGLSKISFVAPGHAWLEGLRKSPELGVRGVGTALSRHALSTLAAMPSLASIRFSTYFDNAPSIALNEALGFVRIRVRSCRSKTLRGDEAQAPLPLNAEAGTLCAAEAAPAYAAFLESGWFDGFIYASWKAWPADSPSRLGLFAQANGIFSLVPPGGGQPAGYIALYADATKRQVSVGALCAADAVSLSALVSKAEQVCLEAGYDCVEFICPPQREKLAPLDALGYTAWEQDEDFFLYEFPMDKLKGTSENFSY